MKNTVLRKIGLFFPCSVLVAGALWGQSVNGMSSDRELVIRGQVFDAETLRPLANTNIVVEDVRNGKVVAGTATARNGSFLLRLAPQPSLRLIVRRIGYEPYRIDEVQTLGSPKAGFVQIPLRPAVIKAEEVVVTASRHEQTAQMAPASVAVVTAGDLRASPVRTFDQVLERVPGITVFRSSGVSVQSLSIRGSSDVAGGGVGNRVLLTIDGRPALTADTGGALWSLVPLGSVEQVEVVKGAFSSLYGSTAMGGVINVITRRPAYRSMTHIRIGAGFFEQPAPAIRFRERPGISSEIALNHSGQRGRLSYFVDAGRKQSDGHAENTSYEFYTFFAKLMIDLRKNRNLEVSTGATISDNAFPHTWLNALQPLRVRSVFHDDRQEKRVYSADVHYWAIPNANLKYATRFYAYRNASRSFFNEKDTSWQRTGNQPLGLMTRVDADKFGSLTQVNYLAGEQHAIIAGLDLQLDRVRSAPDTVMYGNRQANNFAIYLQHEWQPGSALTLTSGLRYDRNHLIGGTTLSQLSPKIALLYRPFSRTAFRLLFGQAFRAPSIAERFFQRELNGGTLFKPNPGLRAERMDFSLEAGLRSRLGDQFEFDLAYFRYRYKDMIFWEEISAEEGVIYTLYQVRNLNRALLQGAEASVYFHRGRGIRAAVSYTFTDARDQSPNRVDDTLPYRAKHALFASFTASQGRFHLNLSGRYQSEIKEVFLYPLDAPDAFFVAHAKLGVALSKKTTLELAAQNLFDTAYEELARYRMPGRNWFLTIGYRL